jgi:Cep192 domain 4/HYDIN/CFA65/VesB-like, Ig-like domain/IPT/TIG domain
MKRILSLLCLLAGTGTLSASAAPALYFTDLTSGPVGAIVTIYGSNLQPAVTVNGVGATIIASSSTKVSFVVPSTTSGSIAMSGSNALPFTVRAGHIFYVATNGSDSNSGSQSAPWASIPYAFNTAACGDVIYAMNGVNQTGLDNYGASLSVQRRCTQDQPLALIGYPGATVTIGSTGGQEFGIRNPDINGDGYDGMVFANLQLRGNNTGLKDVNNEYWRIVGNDFSCPNGGGQAACVHLDEARYVQFLGNSIHDTGAGNTKYYHSFYGTTNTNHVDVGWNHIYNNKSCRGVQFYSTSGSPQYDLVVHDNVITGQQCDGINFSTVDATLGPIKAYNNLVYHVGIGGPNLNSPNEACIASLGYGAPGGEALFYGNTMVDCGSAGGSTAGAITVQAGSPTVVLMSNLVAQSPGEVIYSPNTDQSLVAASYNVLLSQGTAGVVNSSYQPVSGSPAIGAGMAYSGILRDLAGNPRLQSGKLDAGAYLYSTSTPTSGPTATLSTPGLTYGNQTINTTSAAQSATLSNSGTSALAISKIALSGNNSSSFLLAHNCGTSLAAGQSCAVQVQFKPATTGALTANVTFTDDASNPSQSIALSGTGVSTATPSISVTPATLSFASQDVNTTSAAQPITVKNTGTGALSLGGLTVSGTNAAAFKVSNGCGTSLAAGASCAIQVQFVPATAGTLTASLALTSNASNSIPAITLTGTAVNPATGGALTTIHLSLNNLYFYNRAVNSTSAPDSIMVKNTGKAALTVSSLTLIGLQPTSFLVSSTCGSSVAVGGSCTMNVSFVPRVIGTNTATLVLTYNGSPSTISIPLVGHGF